MIRYTAKLLSVLKCKIRIADHETDWIDQDHGVPQGAPDSPALFVHTTDVIMATLHEKWIKKGRSRGKGLMFSVSAGATGENLTLSHAMYADDLLLFCISVKDANEMIADLLIELLPTGLSCSP